MAPYIKPGVYRISDRDARKLLKALKSKTAARQRVIEFEQKNHVLAHAAARLRKFNFDTNTTP